MLVLGIADNHDAGAALVEDDHVVAAVNQERVDRVKLSGAFPWAAIDATLETVGANIKDVDRVIVGTAFTPSIALRLFRDQHRAARDQGTFTPLLNAYIAYQSGLRRTGLHSIEHEANRVFLEGLLQRGGLGHAQLYLYNHHRSHAESAYRTQDDPDALVLTCDAMGDGISATASIGEDGQLIPLWNQSGLGSVGLFYSRITELLGFKPNRHEGKVTGLSACAQAPAALVCRLEQALRFVGPGFNRVNPFKAHRKDDPFYAAIHNYSREEVASAAQVVLERAVTQFVSHWVEKTGRSTVTVAGGIFANVKLNQRIKDLPGVDSLWIAPHMGDGGLAVGAALGHVQAPPTRLRNAYLGPSYSQRDIGRALAVHGIPRTKPKDPIAAVAEHLARGKVVARFAGRLEWGPRALGNRSILYKADDPTVNDWLNEKLSRTEFMPFAPLTLQEDAEASYEGLSTASHAAEFMTVAFQCTSQMKQQNPGVVHVDGTARPQLLNAEANPDLHAILSKYKEKSGSGTVLNTSFNLHEEPIVCTPGDAIRAWRHAELDVLAIGPFVIERE